MTEHYAIERDLHEAEVMVQGLENYLRHDDLYASPVGGFLAFSDMPTLTVGALLMRLRRLDILQAKLSDDQRQRLQAATRQHDSIRKAWRVHYDKKLLREANSRLDSIGQYFADVAQNMDQAAGSYQPEVLKRTIVHDIRDAMAQLKIEDADLEEKVRQVDNRLGAIALEHCDFLWDSQLEPAYPKKDYWWLYRKPPTRHS